MATDTFFPSQMVRSGHWHHLGHWVARSTLVGGATAAAITATGPLALLMLGLLLPLGIVASVGAHLDQFYGERALKLEEQATRWYRRGVELLPVYLLDLILLLLTMLAAGIAGATGNPILSAGIGLGGSIFVGMAWTGAVSHRILAGGELRHSFRVGLRDAGHWLATVPDNLGRALRLRATPSGTPSLLGTWVLTAVFSYLAFLLACGLGLTLAIDGLGVGNGFYSFTCAVTLGASAAWHVFELGVGHWTHHYLAYLAEEQNLLPERSK